jgi:hypothetical protein
MPKLDIHGIVLIEFHERKLDIKKYITTNWRGSYRRLKLLGTNVKPAVFSAKWLHNKQCEKTVGYAKKERKQERYPLQKGHVKDIGSVVDIQSYDG